MCSQIDVETLIENLQAHMSSHAKSTSLYVLVWAHMYENMWRARNNFVRKLTIDYLCSKLELIVSLWS